MRIEVAGHTHVGMKRNHNEDNLLLLPEEALYCVADGMGGHACGEVASKIAVDELAEFFRLTAQDRDATWPYKMDKSRNYDENRLATGIKLANVRIFEHAQSDPKFDKMGTTIVTMHFASGSMYFGHVGDSRGYIFRHGELMQLTEDHSLVNQMIKEKKIRPEDAESFPQKNIILRALGMNDSVQVDIRKVEAREGDIFLLCSDGLSGMVRDAQIQEILSRATNLDAACSALIDAANSHGGADNVTAILARCAA